MANKQEKMIGDDWLTMGDAMETLGISERTLNRMVEKGEVQRQYKQARGRRPMPMFHPGDVETARQEIFSARQHVMPTGQSRELALVHRQDPQEAMLDGMPALAGFAAAILEAAQKPQERTMAAYVQLEEAVVISGLPKAFLLEQAQQGKLKAKKFGRWYFQRAALEAL